MRASTASRLKATCSRAGARVAAIQDSSTYRTISVRTRRGGSTSPIAKTIASRFLTATVSIWTNLHRPCAIVFDGEGHLCVGELGPALPMNRLFRNLGCVVKLLDGDGAPVARIGGDRPAAEPGCFIAPHGIAVDSHGDIYVAEVSYGQWERLFPDTPRPVDLPSLRKLRRVKGGRA
jgi:hypothetical protein